MAAALIVDGYNVIHVSGRYRELARRDLDAARAKLVADVAAYAGRDWDATVVFDGASNPSSTGERHEAAGVGVVFSAHGRDADAVIEELAGAYRRRGDQVTVVTSDAQTQWVVLGQGAQRMSSAGFVDVIEQHTAEANESNPAGSARTTISERIDAKTRESLARWARGER